MAQDKPKRTKKRTRMVTFSTNLKKTFLPQPINISNLVGDADNLV